jgi:hypothetical protein
MTLCDNVMLRGARQALKRKDESRQLHCCFLHHTSCLLVLQRSFSDVAMALVETASGC